MKRTSAFSYVSTILFILSSSCLYNQAYASSRERHGLHLDIPGTTISTRKSSSDRSGGHMSKWVGELNHEFKTFKNSKLKEIEKTEKQKEEAWDDWLTKLEPEWVSFSNFIEEKKKKWIQKKEEEWDIWIKEMEHKWVAFKKKMDRKYKVQRREGTLKYSEREWCNLVKRKAEEVMIIDYRTWIKNNDDNLRKWISRDFELWKKKRFDEWLKVEWKCEEDAYWCKDSNSPFMNAWDPLFPIIKKSWDMYQARKSRESAHWNKLASSVGKTLTSKKYVEWEQMKKTKSSWYNEWVHFFLHELLSSVGVKHRSLGF
ncbi:variable surface protein [Plasmodium gonderi]|uniref:Variable surface protein n=1 Tax=Plasmodium gonderi TaxID=77519 RepID=A0A1Y1JF24_PLAGO|nr:variable surface protein [Plasmodium gonderi]GAW79043.1 variable surface protein [Plasmodium gonderi]